MQFIFIPFALVLGLLLGAGIAIGIFVSLSETGHDWLNKWQTLVSGILALIAGALTVAGIVWQVQRQLDADAAARKETLGRKRMATRALLQSDLSHICHYTEKAATAISSILFALRVGGAARPPVPLPEFPWNVLGNMQSLIEHLDRPEAEVVADMLGAQQVLNARLMDFVNDYNTGEVMTENDADLVVEKCVELRMRADGMFEFASAPTHSKDTGSRLSFSRMVWAGLVQTKGLEERLCSLM